MRILSLRRGFDADHSASTYEFFALDRLTPEQRAAVQALTGQAGRRHLSFHYRGEWRDIPADWPDALLALGYDILVSESYDWWTVALSLPHDQGLLERLGGYECDCDDGGLSAHRAGERIVLSFGLRLDYGTALGALGEDLFEGLAELFEEVRAELLAGDLSAARAIHTTCGGSDDDALEPAVPLSPSSQTLLSLIGRF